MRPLSRNKSNKFFHRRPNFERPSPAPSKNVDEEQFTAKTSIDPRVRLQLEKGSSELTVRAMDILCPIGKGQRGLIVSPPKAGKTTFLKHICQALAKCDPTLKLYCLLIDERP